MTQLWPLITSVIVSLLYGYAWLLVYRQSDPKLDQNQFKINRVPLEIVSGTALLIQAWMLTQLIIQSEGYDLGLTRSTAFAVWVVNYVLVMSWRFSPTQYLSLILLPAGLITNLLATFDSTNYDLIQLEAAALVHVLFSISAFSTLLLAAVQATLLSLQNQKLKAHQASSFFNRCAPLESMENMLFGIIRVGTLFLTIAIITGFVYLEDMFAQHLAHKTLFSILAWFIFCALLVARTYLNIRGTKAVKGTLAGYLLLFLGFLGSKWVLEVLLTP